MKFTLEQLQSSKVWQNPDNQALVAEALRSQGNSLGALARHELQPDKGTPLVKGPRKRARRKGGVVICITIIACGPRLLDDDNLATGAKPLRDSIASGLGIDDGDRRIRWQYRSIETTGEAGVIVTVEAV